MISKKWDYLGKAFDNGVKHHRPVTAAGGLLSKSKVMLEAVAFPQHAMATGGQEEKQAPLFLSESTSP